MILTWGRVSKGEGLENYACLGINAGRIRRGYELGDRKRKESASPIGFRLLMAECESIET